MSFRRIFEVGRIFTIYVSENETVSCEVQTHFGSFPLGEVYNKSSVRIITTFASKNEVVSLAFQTQFGSSLPARFAEKVLIAYSRFLRPKTKLFAVKFRRISEVFSMQALWKSYGRNFTINASKSVTVCHDVQTHFGTSPLARFIKEVMGGISRFMCLKTKLFLWSWDTFWKFSPANFINHFCAHFLVFLRPQTKLFAVKFRRISDVLRFQGLRRKFCTNFNDLYGPKWRCLLWSSHTFWKLSACKVYRKSYGRIIAIYASRNEAVCCKVQTHFGSSPPARFTEKSFGSIFTICVSNKQTFLTSKLCEKLWPRFIILRAHKILVCCSNTLWRSWLSHFIRTHYFESEHISTATAPTNCDMLVWPYANQFQKSLGLAPQICFAISELRKNEQILWNLA